MDDGGANSVSLHSSSMPEAGHAMSGSELECPSEGGYNHLAMQVKELGEFGVIDLLNRMVVQERAGPDHGAHCDDIGHRRSDSVLGRGSSFFRGRLPLCL